MDAFGGVISDVIGYVLLGIAGAGGVWIRQILARARREYEEARQQYAVNENKIGTLESTVKILTEKVEDQASLIQYFQERNADLIKLQNDLQAQYNLKMDKLIAAETALAEAIAARDKFEADLAKIQKENIILQKELETTRAVLTESEREVYRYQGAQRQIKENNSDIKDILLAVAAALDIKVVQVGNVDLEAIKKEEKLL